MTPVIRHLREVFLDQSAPAELNPLDGSFTAYLDTLDPDFYRKNILKHLMLNIEYSLVGQQLREKLQSETGVDQDQVIAQIKDALIIAELLAYFFKHHLKVPREEERLHEQRLLYRQILAEIEGTPLVLSSEDEAVVVGASLSQQIRLNTIIANMYRLLIIRSKRALDLIALLDHGSEKYRHFVSIIDKYTDPILPHVGWFFYLPRLLVNLFLLFKHTVPHPWMSDKEKSLGWSTRFHAQMQRRWFELGNDSAWVAVGFINCFILTGALAPIGIYLGIAFFAFDVAMSVSRTYIELNRLYELRKEYRAMLLEEADPANRRQIEEHLAVLKQQINFETLRLGSHVMTTSIIFLGMSCAAPLFAMNPLIPLIGAICLVMLCLINFALARIIDHCRPRDMIEAPSGVSKLGFFARKDTSPPQSEQEESYVEDATKQSAFQFQQFCVS